MHEMGPIHFGRVSLVVSTRVEQTKLSGCLKNQTSKEELNPHASQKGSNGTRVETANSDGKFHHEKGGATSAAKAI
ncbi:hypothetical protein VFPFJ_04941 [Purpureocillium lilacinum]|uniref:Uncharacterized protein n=1 Tax=Purpureocillium lilacinum TaxID=33203 RepID=A0A179HLP3_PURLI|nr:hypothetical protein VFPFJ_04941 [Purpureocillium lilacinum]OAQ90782.1 hypothetical protein VFPFJ_04941 [Purpureocillium lilacinum]